MKKKLLVSVVLVVALFVGLVSCSKQEDGLNVSITKEQVKIFMRVTSAAPAKIGLKSASIITEDIEIPYGDTVKGAYDIKTFIWSKNNSGQPLSGEWQIKLVKSDFASLPRGNYAMFPFQNFYTGDQIVTTFSEHGLYKVTFGLFVDYNTINEIFTYYVEIGGVPGKVGDATANDHIFRMEKKTLSNNQTQKDEDLIFIYFKYSENIVPESAWCIGNLCENGTNTWFELQAKRWPFSKENYYYIVISAYHADYYMVNFTTKVYPSQGFGWMVDVNNHKSSYSKNGQGIYFTF